VRVVTAAALVVSGLVWSVVLTGVLAPAGEVEPPEAFARLVALVMFVLPAVGLGTLLGYGRGRGAPRSRSRWHGLAGAQLGAIVVGAPVVLLALG
jgi:hypothetical protein